MARDLKVDDKGDLVLDPVTHDLAMVSGIEEVAQRIKATLEIRYGEMDLLDPEMGTDYTDFFSKGFNENDAATQLRDTIMRFVPEVESVDEIQFTVLPNRRLKIDFKVTASTTENEIAQTIKGGVELGD